MFCKLQDSGKFTNACETSTNYGLCLMYRYGGGAEK